MAAHALAPLIVCANSSEDLVDLLVDVMKGEGFRAVPHVSSLKVGTQPTIDLLTQLHPPVCVYAVSLPYRESWAEFQQIRQAVPTCAFVVTTTNKRALDELVGPTDTHEIIGKPFDIDELVTAVRRVLAAG